MKIGVSYMWSMTLTISWRIQFFLSTTQFCWGVQGTGYSCLIPFELQKRLTSILSNSLLFITLIVMIRWPVSTWILLHKDLKCSMVLDFSLRKQIKEYLKKSSTTTRAYLFLPLLSMHMGPMRFTWRKSKGPVMLIPWIFLCVLFTCLPFMHSS